METKTHDFNKKVDESECDDDDANNKKQVSIQPSSSISSSSLNTVNSENDLTTQQQETNDETTNSRKRKRTSNVIFKPSTTATRSSTNKRKTNNENQQQSTNDDLTNATSTPPPPAPVTTTATSNNKASKTDWKVGLLVEARDSKQNWYPSRIIQIDDEKNRVKVHFHGWNSRYDQWFDKKSSDLRQIKGSNNQSTSSAVGLESTTNNTPLLNNNKIKSLKERFNIGDKVLAKWIDNFYYSASVLRQVNKNNTLYYEVKFEADGVKKMIRYDNCKKYNQNEDQQFIIQQSALSATPSTIISEVSVVSSGTESGSLVAAAAAQPTSETPAGTTTTTTTASTETSDEQQVKTDNSNVRKSTRVKRQRTFSDDMVADYRLNKSLTASATPSSKKRKITEPTTNEQQSTTPQIKAEENESKPKQQQIESPLSLRKKAPLGNYLKSLSLRKPNKKRDKTESISESVDESIAETRTEQEEIEDEEQEQEKAAEAPKQTTNELQQQAQVEIPKTQPEEKQKSSIKLKIKLNSSSTASLNELKDDQNKLKIETPTSVPVIISKTSAFNYQLYNKSLSTIESSPSSSSNELIKCVYSNCNKTFRKQSLLDYHIKYHHYEDGRVIEVKPKKKRGEETSAKPVKSQVSTESQLSVEPAEEEDPYEVIHCECGRNLSEGFMIQCDQCYCWQHGDCCNISEDNPPKTHNCWICSSSKDKIKYNSWLNNITNDENKSIFNNKRQLYSLLNECSQQIAYLNRLSYDFECELSILKNIDKNSNNNIDYEKVMSNCEKLQHVLEEQSENLNAKIAQLEDKYGLDTKKLLNVDLVDYIQKLGESIKAQ